MPTGFEELREHRRTLCGAFLAMALGVAALPYYTAGLFLSALAAEFGWSRSQISLGPTLLILGIMLSAPLVGWLGDRFGARRLVAPSLVALALCYLVLSRMGGDIRGYYVALAAMSILAAGSGAPTLTRIIIETFHQRRGTALGILLGGIGIASALGTPLLAQLIQQSGWRTGYVAIALVTLAGTPIATWLLRAQGVASTPSPEPPVDDGTPAEPASRRTFWILGCCFFLVALASTGLIVHLVPLLGDRGLPMARAAGIAGAVGACVVVARLATGLLVDRWFAPRVASVLMLIAAAAFLLFGFGGEQFAIAGAIGIGLSFGAEMDLIGYLVSRYFGRNAYGRYYGILYALCMAGTAASPLVYGLVAERLGGYEPMLGAAVVMLGLSALLFRTLPPFPVAGR